MASINMNLHWVEKTEVRRDPVGNHERVEITITYDGGKKMEISLFTEVGQRLAGIQETNHG